MHIYHYNYILIPNTVNIIFLKPGMAKPEREYGRLNATAFVVFWR